MSWSKMFGGQTSWSETSWSETSRSKRSPVENFPGCETSRSKTSGGETSWSIAPGQEQTAPRGQSFDVNKNVLSLRSFVATFKTMPLKSDFIQFYHDLIHVYSPGAGANSPQGATF